MLNNLKNKYLQNKDSLKPALSVRNFTENKKK